MSVALTLRVRNPHAEREDYTFNLTQSVRATL